MDIGRIFNFPPNRSAPAGDRQRVPSVAEAGYEAAPREQVRRTRTPEPAVEGELLARERGAHAQSTQEFLYTRQAQAGSAEAQRADTRHTLSHRNRLAMGLYQDNIRPESRRSFTTGRAVDAFV